MTLHVRLSERQRGHGAPDSRGGAGGAARRADVPDAHRSPRRSTPRWCASGSSRRSRASSGSWRWSLICVGLYGLMAFSVARRTRGDRRARRARAQRRRTSARLVGRQAMRVLVIGLAIGVPAAWIAGRLASPQLASLLFGLTPSDPISFGAATALLALVTLCRGDASRRCARHASTRSSRCATNSSPLHTPGSGRTATTDSAHRAADGTSVSN